MSDITTNGRIAIGAKAKLADIAGDNLVTNPENDTQYGLTGPFRQLDANFSAENIQNVMLGVAYGERLSSGAVALGIEDVDSVALIDLGEDFEDSAGYVINGEGREDGSQYDIREAEFTRVF